MTKVLQCGDVLAGCPATVEANSEEEVMRQAAEHVRAAHGMNEMDDATVTKVREAITTA